MNLMAFIFENDAATMYFFYLQFPYSTISIIFRHCLVLVNSVAIAFHQNPSLTPPPRKALFPAPNDQSEYSWTVCELDLCNAHAGTLAFAF
jgi:hypothetical protein